MKIRCESIEHFLPRVAPGPTSGVVGPYAMAGFSDAEWYCILGLRTGEKTGLGQILDPEHGKLLLDVLRRRQGDPRFFCAVPKCLYGLPHFCDGQIDWLLGREDIRLEAVERDMLTDNLAEEAGLHPLIKRLQDFPVVLIGPEPLRATKDFLRYAHFVPISTPNLHQEPGGIERAVGDALAFTGPAVHLVSAGVSAAVIIDRLYEAKPDSWYLDCGSIWDAFVGIGGQRVWRAKLYANPQLWERWKRENLVGKKSCTL